MRALATALLVTNLLLAFPSAPALAQGLKFFEAGATAGVANLSVGRFNVVNRGEGSARMLYQLEIAPSFALVGLEGYFSIHPLLGGWITGDEGRMAYGGFQIALPLAETLELRLSGALGPFDKGSGKDLNSDVLFHVGVAVFYVTQSDWRLGFAVTHQSHGHLFSSKRNVGAESAMISIGIPFESWF